MISPEEIREIDTDEIGLLVREAESTDDLETFVWFAQELRGHAIDELQHRSEDVL